MSDEEYPNLLYQKLVLCQNGLSVSELTSIFELSEKEVSKNIQVLKKRGLVEFDGTFVRPVIWWKKDHLELFLNVPRVSQNTFFRYCKEIDNFCKELQNSGYNAIRPYLHETSIEIIIGAIAAFTVVEFSKGVLSELGKKLATFVGKATNNFVNEGITNVEIKGIRKLKGHTDIVFSICGKDAKSVSKGFTDIVKSIEKSENDLENKEMLNLKKEDWELIIKKVIKQ